MAAALPRARLFLGRAGRLDVADRQRSRWPPLLLYAGCILWVIGYDTIYALQDVEDDALIGVKSTARLFGDKREAAGCGCSMPAAIACWLVGGRDGWAAAAIFVPLPAGRRRSSSPGRC